MAKEMIDDELSRPSEETEPKIELPDKPILAPEAQLVNLKEIHEGTNMRQSTTRIEELAESIRVRGLIHPVVVRKTPPGAKHKKPYELIVGFRRKAAFDHLKRNEIPAIIKQVEDEEILAEIITENYEREDPSPVSEARAMKQMMEINGWTQAQVAAQLGVHRTQVTKRLALLELPTQVVDWVEEGQITPSHAEVLTGLKNSEAIEEVAALTVKTQPSVAKLTAFAKKINAENIEEVEPEKELEDLNEQVPAEVSSDPQQGVTPLPRLKLKEDLSPEDLQAAQLYILLRNGNDREMWEYLEEHYGVLYEDLWDWIEQLTPEQIVDQLEVMTRRWMMAAHRYPSFPMEFTDRFGEGEEIIGPSPLELPEDLAPDFGTDDDEDYEFDFDDDFDSFDDDEEDY